MPLTVHHFLIVCPLVFLAGFVDAVAGGGGLISLPAYMIAGIPVHNSIATNKLSSGMGTTLATIRYARKGYILWSAALCSVLTALIGSSIGARLALMVNDYYFKILMLAILPVTACYVLRGRALIREQEALPLKMTIPLSMAIAFVIGVYDGFYGPGTGTFLILLLTSLVHMDLKTANGVTKVINLTTNLTSLSVFLLNGKVILPLGLAAGLFNIAGNYLGTSLFDREGSKAVKPIMITVLVIFFIRVLHDLWG